MSKSSRQNLDGARVLFGGQRVFSEVLSHFDGNEVALIAPISKAAARFTKAELKRTYVWNVSTNILHNNNLNRMYDEEYIGKSGSYKEEEQFLLVGMFKDRESAQEQAASVAQTYVEYFTKSPEECKHELKSATKLSTKSQKDGQEYLEEEGYTYTYDKPKAKQIVQLESNLSSFKVSIKAKGSIDFGLEGVGEGHARDRAKWEDTVTVTVNIKCERFASASKPNISKAATAARNDISKHFKGHLEEYRQGMWGDY